MIVFYRVRAVTCTRRIFEMARFVVCPFSFLRLFAQLDIIIWLYIYIYVCIYTSLSFSLLNRKTEFLLSLANPRIEYFFASGFTACENASDSCIIRGCNKRIFRSLRDEARRGSDRCERFLSLWESLSITCRPVRSETRFRPFTGARKWAVLNKPMYSSPTIRTAKKRRSRRVSPKRIDVAISNFFMAYLISTLMPDTPPHCIIAHYKVIFMFTCFWFNMKYRI